MEPPPGGTHGITPGPPGEPFGSFDKAYPAYVSFDPTRLGNENAGEPSTGRAPDALDQFGSVDIQASVTGARDLLYFNAPD